MNDNISRLVEELIKTLDKCNPKNEYEFVERFAERMKEAEISDEGADDVE